MPAVGREVTCQWHISLNAPPIKTRCLSETSQESAQTDDDSQHWSTLIVGHRTYGRITRTNIHEGCGCCLASVVVWYTNDRRRRGEHKSYLQPFTDLDGTDRRRKTSKYSSSTLVSFNRTSFWGAFATKSNCQVVLWLTLPADWHSPRLFSTS